MWLRWCPCRGLDGTGSPATESGGVVGSGNRATGCAAAMAVSGSARIGGIEGAGYRATGRAERRFENGLAVQSRPGGAVSVAETRRTATSLNLGRPDQTFISASWTPV